MSQFSSVGGSGSVEVDQAGTKISFRPKINFIGATVVDNPTTNAADITIASSGGNIDGGAPDSVYAPQQHIDCGGP